VLGETGTGKELVAREAHALSPRRSKPFVAINCGAIPENLLESELFGHKKGAFTGAVADKIGRIEAAGGGTLFLDEIGEMPMNLQVKLLRVLQERVIERVGELKPREIDIRVIAATNKDLEELIKGGGFREDLFYRLNEIAISLPPLRDRGEDIDLLAQYFLNNFKTQYPSKSKGYTNQALLAMKNYYWPGNVRELENRVKKAVIMSDRALLNPDDLGVAGSEKRDIKNLADAQEEFKVDYIKKVLELNNWNKAQTARDLGVDARTIFRYIEKFTDEAG
ncbi:MAG: sigma-54-dependent Fis family transcriptional regulator, partial [Proteobacteria bacterium]|nr:sigma-54-dependent Fis family transcriptional regulator [Pseudomonadota bacterium]